MKIKRTILFVIIVILIYVNIGYTYGVNCLEVGDYVNKSEKAIMIYSSMSGTPTNNYLLKNQKFTIDWYEDDYFGTQVVSISLPNGTGGFLFLESDACFRYCFVIPNLTGNTNCKLSKIEMD